MLTKESPALYGLIAEYDTPEDLLKGCAAARDAGYKNLDAFAPFPVEGLSQACGFKDKFIPILMLCGGIVGICWGLGLQIFGLGASYALNIGGRPLWSWPNFFPITFEATVLTASFTGVIMMFALNGLPQPYHPVFDAPNFDRASTDKFFLLLEAKDRNFDLGATRKLLESTPTVRVSAINLER
jgi:hypothetical protein